MLLFLQNLLGYNLYLNYQNKIVRYIVLFLIMKTLNFNLIGIEIILMCHVDNFSFFFFFIPIQSKFHHFTCVCKKNDIDHI